MGRFPNHWLTEKYFNCFTEDEAKFSQSFLSREQVQIGEEHTGWQLRYNYKCSHIRFGKFAFTYIHIAQFKHFPTKNFKAGTGTKRGLQNILFLKAFILKRKRTNCGTIWFKIQLLWTSDQTNFGRHKLPKSDPREYSFSGKRAEPGILLDIFSIIENFGWGYFWYFDYSKCQKTTKNGTFILLNMLDILIMWVRKLDIWIFWMAWPKNICDILDVTNSWDLAKVSALLPILELRAGYIFEGS